MDGYMTTAQAAEALGVSKGRVHALIREGRLDAERFGRGYAITAESVERRKASNPGPGNPDFREPGYHGKARKRPQMPEGRMTATEAAAILGVSAARVRELIGQGRLEAVKVSGCNAISAESVAAYIERGPLKPGRKA